MVLSAQPEIEEWSSWDEEAPTSIKIEGGNGNVSPSPNDIDEEPDYFKDMTPTIRKTQKVSPQTVQLTHYYQADVTLRVCINVFSKHMQSQRLEVVVSHPDLDTSCDQLSFVDNSHTHSKCGIYCLI